MTQKHGHPQLHFTSLGAKPKFNRRDGEFVEEVVTSDAVTCRVPKSHDFGYVKIALHSSDLSRPEVSRLRLRENRSSLQYPSRKLQTKNDPFYFPLSTG